jgi:acyl-CoA synthetase (AMP-forming)/AMP-acid ligase II
VRTVGDIILRNAKLAPRRTAVVFEDRRLSFAQLAERATRLAGGLARRGVRRQDRIAILAQNCSEYVEVFAAGELAGYMTATVNYRLAPPEIAYILNDAGASALVFQADYADLVGQLRGVLSESLRFLSIGPAPGWAESYEDVLRSGSATQLPSRAGEDDTAYLIYTSGTTGRPKGVMLGQRGQLRTAEVLALESSVEPTDRVLLVMPLYHVGAKCQQLGFHYRGATVVLQRAFDPRAVLETIQSEGITVTLLAPVMIQALLEVPDLRRYDLSSLRTLYYSAAPMPTALLRRAIDVFGPIFAQFYGMTESGPMGTTLHKHQHLLDGRPEEVRRLASAGQPFPSCEVRIVDDNGRDCPIGEPGEVLLRNDTLMQGYWNNSVATEQTIRDGWLHTGDVGVLDDEDYLFIVDRKKDMIVSGGENIYPREVEEALYQHTAVAEAAVIGVPDERWGEAVKAFVVLKPGRSADPGELIEHCRTLVASYKKPKSVDFVASLPRLPNGKINKVELREPYWEGSERRV